MQMTETSHQWESSVRQGEDSGSEAMRVALQAAYAVLSSLFTFAWVYVVLFLSFRAVMAATASYFGIEPLVTLERIVYQRGDLWYPHAVKHTYVIGTVFMSLVALALMAVYRISTKGPRIFRLTVLWGIIISAAMVVQRMLGVVLSDIFEFSELARLGVDLGVYATYVRMSMGERGVLAASGMVVGLLVGLFVAKPMAQTAMTQKQARANRTNDAFLVNQIMIPLTLGLILAAVVVYPASLMTHVLFITAMVFVTMGMLIGRKMAGKVRIMRDSVAEVRQAVPVVIFVVIALAVRLIFAKGVHF